MHWLIAVIAAPLCLGSSLDDKYTRLLEQRVALETSRRFFIERTQAIDDEPDIYSIQAIARELADATQTISPGTSVKIMRSGQRTVNRIFNAAQQAIAGRYIDAANTWRFNFSLRYEVPLNMEIFAIEHQLEQARLNEGLIRCMGVIDEFLNANPEGETISLTSRQLDQFQMLLKDASDPRSFIEYSLSLIEPKYIGSALAQLKAALKKDVRIDGPTVAELSTELQATSARREASREACLAHVQRWDAYEAEIRAFLAIMKIN